MELFGNEDVYGWLAENAYKYGFVLRYPPGKQKITGTSYEPWHYRYVGEEAAKEIYERGICLEEYFKQMIEEVGLQLSYYYFPLRKEGMNC